MEPESAATEATPTSGIEAVAADEEVGSAVAGASLSREVRPNASAPVRIDAAKESSGVTAPMQMPPQVESDEDEDESDNAKP